MLSIKLLPSTLKSYRHALTPKRLWNAGKVITSYALSNIFKRDIRLGKPFVLMVEPTNFCNLKCPLCPSGNGEMTRPRGTMELERFEKVLKEQAEHLFLLMLWNQGEPFINKHLTDMVRIATAHNVPTLTSTNVHYIKSPEIAEDIVDSGLSEIIVSLDGVTSESYVKYRVGGNFDRVLDGIRLLVEAKKKLKANHPVIHLQFIIMKHNEHEIEAARNLSQELGVDRLSLKTAQVYTEEEAETFLPEDENLSRYDYGVEKLSTKSKIANTCRHLWYSTVINWDGAVSPCCFDKDVHYGLGTAGNAQPFDAVWTGEKYTDFRNAILNDRASVPICNNCSEGIKGLFYDIEQVKP
ncbi:MAG: radical SAM protein [Candidatus Latescibacteria bacterium]|jgi:MoaA/NifB/PqqE/SkfB family radical SAM enzyme|nr:radical SAM protein [Candidatus Latescibacterota bacterium]